MPYKGNPPATTIEEEPTDFEAIEEILRLKNEYKALRTRKILRQYFVNFANSLVEDARWMQDPQLKDSLALQEYKTM